MARDLFRKKSIEEISSPEDLDDYIKVTTPGIWMLLGALLLLGAGALVYLISGLGEWAF